MSAGLELRRLSVGYPRRPLFEGLDLECVAPGALVALVGPNAVGKSTLLKAIAGLRPARGQVLLDGTDLATLPRAHACAAWATCPRHCPRPPRSWPTRPC